MIECLILGDSIAQGVANVRTECRDYAQVGATSKQVNDRYRGYNLDAKTVVISLGTNDHAGVNTRTELTSLRSRVHAQRVIWLLPAAVNPTSGTNVIRIQQAVKDIADRYGDIVLTLPQPLADRYHPTATGYRRLAEQTR